MNTPIIFAADAKYPMDLKAAEGAEVATRRRLNQIDSAAPQVGFALSGGGIRSATFCLGFFQALARQKLIRRIDYLSTVSGGGYFGSFLGAAFSRENATPEKIEAELANNHSWSVNWLRENGRFLSPNGAGDNWQTAAVALRNWCALHVVLLAAGFLLLGLAALLRADLAAWSATHTEWIALERFFWQNRIGDLWLSPWLILPLASAVVLMVPAGTIYWLTQASVAMCVLRRLIGVVARRYRSMSDDEFISRAQNFLSRTFMIGLVVSVVLLAFAAIDSLGQSAYLVWSHDFSFPSVWALLTAAGTLAFGFGSRVAVVLERFLGKRRFRIPLTAVAFMLAAAWLILIVVALSVISCGFGWNWATASTDGRFHPMTGGDKLLLVVALCFAASWIFSRSFGFVNLSSIQQVYAARLSRAYLGASNPDRRHHRNFDMTDLIPGDEIALDHYAPHLRGGPLHLINVTVNETLSGKTQIERRDRKGLAMAVGPCGLSVGHDSHALWANEPPRASALSRLQALWESRRRAITPIDCGTKRFHALCENKDTDDSPASQRVEALALGRWSAISGAAFTTGTGANTSFGLSLLLGLANVRLGYWWDSGIDPSCRASAHPNALELVSRVLSRLLPVQTCLLNEFFARFHGPARQHWYLSDGGHFENTGCYELVRRRVPFIVCVDAGQDATYQFADFANLVRKARTDFRAEIQLVRRCGDAVTDDPGIRFPMPKLEDVVHPSLLDVIGVPEDFTALCDETETGEDSAEPRAYCSRRHALLARIHYTDTDEFSWLLLIKPSLMGDEAADVVQYHRTHPLFPQEPTTDQYFDEAQWESYRKLGEHIGTELFTPPAVVNKSDRANWSPSHMTPPKIAVVTPPADLAMAG